jgi:putative NADPH-quinone reductase
MKKKILVVLGHPSDESLNKGIADAYVKGAKKNFDVKKIYLSEIKFDPILHNGYHKIQMLEPDLVKAQKLIKWAEHIVWVYPMWWGSMPAIMKGFLDRVFLPGFAFKFGDDGKLNKYLTGRTSSLIITTGGSTLLYTLFGKIMNLPLWLAFLRFCGIRLKRQIFISEIRKVEKEKAKEIFEKAERLGERGF